MSAGARRVRWARLASRLPRRLKSDGAFADGRYRKQHPRPCDAWGKQARYGDETWEQPILAQVAGIELDPPTIGAVVAALGGAPRPVALDRARIGRQIRDLALEHAAGHLEDEVYLESLRDLREAKDDAERTRGERVAADRAIEWLRTLSATWTEADVPEARADVLHAIYDQIVVTGREIVSVRLTSSAYAHGLALALPTKVALARPTGVRRACTHSGIRLIPIDFAGDWDAAARRSA